MPMPFATRYVSDTSSSITNRNATPKPAYHPSGDRRVSTIELILSVTELKV